MSASSTDGSGYPAKENLSSDNVSSHYDKETVINIENILVNSESPGGRSFYSESYYDEPYYDEETISKTDTTMASDEYSTGRSSRDGNSYSRSGSYYDDETIIRKENILVSSESPGGRSFYSESYYYESYYDEETISKSDTESYYYESYYDSEYDEEAHLIETEIEKEEPKWKIYIKKAISRLKEELIKTCHAVLEMVKRFLNSDPHEFYILKLVLGFLLGALLGYALYQVTIKPMDFPLGVRRFMGGVLVLGTAIGYALSVQVRCILWLLVPTFFGSTGRAYVEAFAVVFIVSGPIHNIVLNGKEIVRSLGCHTQLASNHTALKWELASKPVGHVMEQFQEEGMMINKVVKRIEKTFEPLKKEIIDESEEKKMRKTTSLVDRLSGSLRGNRLQKLEKRNKVKNDKDRADKVESKYRKKMEYRCEGKKYHIDMIATIVPPKASHDVWNKAVLNCRKKFNSLEDRCLDKVPIVGYLLCLPFKLTVFCKLIRVIQDALDLSCDAMRVLDSGFGKTYVAAQDMVAKMQASFEVNLQYKIAGKMEALDYTTAEEIRKGTMHEFDRRKLWMDFLMAVMKRILSFTFILVIIRAYKYEKKYLCDFKFDNLYITGYFRHIDDRRKEAGKKVLLPLKKVEAKDFIFPTSTRIMKVERKSLSKGTYMLLMKVLVGTVIILSDGLLFDVLDIIQRNSRIDYRHQGEYSINIDIFGVGFMSEIVRLFLQGFESEHKVDDITTNYECLPKPKIMEWKYAVYIYSVFAAVWLLLVFQAYGLRMRRFTASFFYRKREKKRILYLYNSMLKKRKGSLRHMRHHARKMVKYKKLMYRLSMWTLLRVRYRKLEPIFRRLPCTREKCLVCNEPEKADFQRCKTPACDFGYCPECWFDLKQRCLACQPIQEGEEDFSELTDDHLFSD